MSNETVRPEQEHLDAIFRAFIELQKMGFTVPLCGPKDGSEVEIIEVGSSGIHRGAYEGKWPNGRWWIFEDETWPSHPFMVRKVKP